MDKRAIFDSLLTDLKLAPSAGSQDAFPLDRALVLIDERTTQREELLQQIAPESAQDRRLGGMLVICDAVSVATKAAIAMVEKEGDNAREQSAALVDLWGKAEGGPSRQPGAGAEWNITGTIHGLLLRPMLELSEFSTQ